MLVSCGKCGHPVDWGARACPKCGKPQTLEAFLRSGYRKLRQRFSQPVLVACPNCKRRVPASELRCPNCDADMSVEAVYRATVETGRRRWDAYAKGLSLRAKRRIRWGYCLLSGFLLWEVVGYAESHFAEHWVRHAALSAVYLGVILLLFVSLAPREKLKEFARRASAPIKLGMFFNYLTLLMLLQIAIGTFWTRATMIAGLFAVSWVGAHLFIRFIEPEWRGFVGIVFDEPDTAVDPSAPQGRHGRVG